MQHPGLGAAMAIGILIKAFKIALIGAVVFCLLGGLFYGWAGAFGGAIGGFIVVGILALMLIS